MKKPPHSDQPTGNEAGSSRDLRVVHSSGVVTIQLLLSEEDFQSMDQIRRQAYGNGPETTVGILAAVGLRLVCEQLVERMNAQEASSGDVSTGSPEELVEGPWLHRSALISRWRAEAREADEKAQTYGRRGLETSATMYRSSADTLRLCALDLEKEISRQNRNDGNSGVIRSL